MSVYASAVSGLLAQSVVLGAHAQNIANAGVTGKPNPGPGDRVAYQPVDAVTISNEGSVAASLIPRDPSSVNFYDPDSIDSNDEGLVAYPNVSLEDEVVGLLTAKNSYIADAKVISVQRKLDKELLDIIA
jgi:flagellar basal-body rod protein FlgC